jgi:hypothetical protein
MFLRRPVTEQGGLRRRDTAKPAMAPLNPAQNLYPHQPTLRLALQPHVSVGNMPLNEAAYRGGIRFKPLCLEWSQLTMLAPEPPQAGEVFNAERSS